ncbi:hypothetical protein [Phenylobacterium sp.]|jgi:hypothetical protein|uniref:hypothetical protein n=1 Tax=Phenylobacterium sp. TaxID=1871053 RepID=UPI0025D3B2BC|nr:hypothetical protein [Phenylobacterium sp.]|tara:strand:+ start:485 stop:793 length:309 start_codon:yes stop_codon:yes gene_type:complete
MIGRVVILTLLIIFCLSFFIRTSDAALICIEGWKNLVKATEDQNEELKFVGVNAVGHAVYFFTSDAMFTFFFTPDGHNFCTNEALMGTTVKPHVEELKDASK